MIVHQMLLFVTSEHMSTVRQWCLSQHHSWDEPQFNQINLPQLILMGSTALAPTGPTTVKRLNCKARITPIQSAKYHNQDMDAVNTIACGKSAAACRNMPDIAIIYDSTDPSDVHIIMHPA